MQKVLIITYYWPPCGGSAVLRWLKFARYLPENGWQPVIYTPLNPEPQEWDEALAKEIPEEVTVIRRKITEPYTLYKLLTGRKKTDRLGVGLMGDQKSRSTLSRLSLWIRSNLFIPDPRMLWIRPSARFLEKYLKENPVQAIVTTGPPHSMHLIGLRLKKSTGIPWVADFRDPWTRIDFYEDLPLTRRSDRRHRELERKVLQNADLVLTVSPTMTREFQAMGARRVITLTNGHDIEIQPVPATGTGKFTLMHLGSLPSSRNPEVLWSVLAELAGVNTDFREKLEIRLIGKSDPSVEESLRNHGLIPNVRFESYIPHEETPAVLMSASLVLLVINNTQNAQGILTNKFFEYLAAGRPILGIGPVDGDAAQILHEAGAGAMFGYSDATGLSSHILAQFTLFEQGKLQLFTAPTGKYSRRTLTIELARILKAI